MKSPTKKELKIILESLRSTQSVVETITEFPRVAVNDKDGYLSKLIYALNDACIKLCQMIKQEERENGRKDAV